MGPPRLDFHPTRAEPAHDPGQILEIQSKDTAQGWANRDASASFFVFRCTRRSFP